MTYYSLVNMDIGGTVGKKEQNMGSKFLKNFQKALKNLKEGFLDMNRVKNY